MYQESCFSPSSAGIFWGLIHPPIRLKSFGEVHLIMFEKYSKRRIDLDFCDMHRGEEKKEELRILAVGYIYQESCFSLVPQAQG